MVITGVMEAVGAYERRDGKEAGVTLRGVDVTVANALRRVIHSDIPYVAAHVGDDGRLFRVAANTSKLHNDMLCDRLALVPIHLTAAEVDAFIPGSIKVRVNVENKSRAPVDVTSAHFRVTLFDKPHPSPVARLYPPCPVTGDWVLLTRLFPGERVDVEVTLERNTAAVHAAYCVASMACFTYEEDAEEHARLRREIEAAPADAGERAAALNYHDTIGRYRTFKRDTHGRPVGVSLRVESESGLGAKDILMAAAKVLLGKFAEGGVEPEETERAGDEIRYLITNQGHTFGSVMQSVCMDRLDELGISVMGYYETHPLERKIVVRVKLAPGGADAVDPADLFSRAKLKAAAAVEEVMYALRDAFRRSP